MKKHFHPFAHLALLASWLFICASVFAAGEKKASLPRYKLTVGQELKYHSTSDWPYLPKVWGGADRTRKERNDWRFWVVGENHDGSWRIVFDWQHEWWVSGARDKKIGKSHVFRRLGLFRIHPDGRIIQKDHADYGPNPSDLFPLLPASFEIAIKGWNDDSKSNEYQSHFTGVASPRGADGSWVFHETRQDSLDASAFQKCQYTFDTRRGLVTRAETEGSRSGGITLHGKNREKGTTLLVATGKRDAKWLKQLDLEAASLLVAEKASADLTARALNQRNPALLAEAESKVKTTRDSLSLGCAIFITWGNPSLS